MKTIPTKREQSKQVQVRLTVETVAALQKLIAEYATHGKKITMSDIIRHATELYCREIDL